MMPRLTPLKESLSAFWLERQPRERQALFVALSVVVLTILYSLAIAPAWNGRITLEKSLPPLRAQAAELQSLAKQALALTSVSAPPVVRLTKAMVDTALARQGIKPQNVLVTGEIIKVQLSQASFAGVVSWLDEMQKNAGCAVLEANVEALPAADVVNASLTLRQQSMHGADE